MMAEMAMPAVIFVCIVILYALREQLEKGEETLENFSVAGATTMGTRTVQQDYYGVKESQGRLLMVLADGHEENGEIAAKIAVDTSRELFQNGREVSEKQKYYFRRVANAANKKIHNVLEEREGSCALTTVLINGLEMSYAIVGNGRLAVYREGDLIPVNEGQTIDVLAKQRYFEGKITRQKTLALLDDHRQYNALGTDSFAEIEFFSKPLTLRPKDLVVLMSEGIFNTLSWKELEKILSEQKPIQGLSEEIISCVEKTDMKDKANGTILIAEVTR